MSSPPLADINMQRGTLLNVSFVKKDTVVDTRVQASNDRRPELTRLARASNRANQLHGEQN
jgi:hypothetical protein